MSGNLSFPQKKKACGWRELNGEEERFATVKLRIG